MKAPVCESCGMPIQKPSEFGGGKTDNKYCVHCTDQNGNLLSYQEKLLGSINFIKSRMDISDSEAKKMAIENLSKMPAWKNR